MLLYRLRFVIEFFVRSWSGDEYRAEMIRFSPSGYTYGVEVRTGFCHEAILRFWKYLASTFGQQSENDRYSMLEAPSIAEEKKP